ncbi:hypothetical protein ACHAXR_009301 [Thalassiosira sp. AJA248-18]
MGLFDEESDSDDAGPTAASSTNNSTGGNNEEDYEEEEDPLDAYMKSLDAGGAQSTTSSTKNSSGGGRLDVDAEDEATSHWETASKTKSSGGARLLLPKHEGGEEEDVGFPGESKSLHVHEARSAMSSTFVRAGGTKTQSASKDKAGGYDDDDDDDFDNLHKVRKQQQQMLHQEVDPLEHIDHKNIRYDSFQRVFYTPSDTKAGAAWRKEHEVVCTPSNFDPVLGFGDLGGVGAGQATASTVFPEELIRTIAQSGYDSPTLVQSQTLSVALSGNDALITAATGSGKTLAYIWPMVVHINDQPHIVPGVDGPIGVVLTPTRELAKQVYKYAKTFIECIGGKAVEVAGGNRGTWELTKELKKGCEIVVSSPGRLIDMVKKKGTNLKRVTFLVLDEADRMLDMGFEKQVNSILENIRPDRQTLLLSATFGKRVEKVARSWLRNPVRIAVGRTGSSSEHVDSHVMVLPSRDAKVQWLLEMLPVLSPLGRCLVFVATRTECDSLCLMVQNSPAFTGGVATIVSIHGDKDQRDRNSAISQFKKNSQSILIATDVAARGLDIPNVVCVINYDAAKNIDAHVHRVGRAGRLSKEGNDGTGGQHQKGVAYTLLTKQNANFAASLAEAFDREGREVSQELAALCQKSNRFGGGRMKHSKDGLGFGGGNLSSSVGSHYGPRSSDQPAKKKSRWS